MIKIEININTNSNIAAEIYREVLQKLGEEVSSDDIASLHKIKDKLTTEKLRKVVSLIKAFSR